MMVHLSTRTTSKMSGQNMACRPEAINLSDMAHGQLTTVALTTAWCQADRAVSTTMVDRWDGLLPLSALAVV